jgi:hypothetical protein
MKILHHILLSLLLAVSLNSCAGNGYISSSIHTVVGLDVSENPKTQVPHVRFGYVRSGLYYVPTGKSPGPPESTSSENVSDTPELVSEIFVNANFLSSMTINEKFAIGKSAVQSPTAQTAFASTAGQQVAIGTASISGPRPTPNITHVPSVVYTGPRPGSQKPPVESLTTEQQIIQLQVNLQAAQANGATNAQFGKLIGQASATKNEVLDLGNDYAGWITNNIDSVNNQKALTDLLAKSAKPHSEW